MDLHSEAVVQLEQWRVNRNPVGAMYQPADGSVHCSLLGYVDLTSEGLFIRDETKPASVYFRVDLSRTSKSHLVPMTALPILRHSTSLTEALKDRLAAAFSFESGAVLVVFDISDDSGAQDHASKARPASVKTTSTVQ